MNSFLELIITMCPLNIVITKIIGKYHQISINYKLKLMFFYSNIRTELVIAVMRERYHDILHIELHIC